MYGYGESHVELDRQTLPAKTQNLKAYNAKFVFIAKLITKDKQDLKSIHPFEVFDQLPVFNPSLFVVIEGGVFERTVPLSLQLTDTLSFQGTVDSSSY